MARVPQTTMQPSFAGGEWAPSLSARADLAKYQTALAKCRNMLVHPHGGVSNRPGTKFVATTKNGAHAARLIPFQFSTEQSYILEFGHQYMRVISGDGLVVDGATIVEISTPYAHGDLARLNYTQSGDVVYLVHPLYPPQRLARTSHTAWTLTAVQFGSALATPTGVSASAGGAYSYRVTACTDKQESAGSIAVTAGAGATLTWTAVSGAVNYSVYFSRNGIYAWVADVSETTYITESDTTKLKTQGDLTICCPNIHNPFSSAGNYPSVVAFNEQRMVFGGTADDPQTFWGSCTGDFHNFNKASPLRDDDAYEFTIDSGQVNSIRALVSLNELIIFTAGEEWKADGGDSGITPTNIKLTYQSGNGCSRLQPLRISENVLYVQASAAAVRDLGYSLEADGYRGNDLSIMANHLFFNRTIKAWCHQRHPDSIVWCVRDDGALLGLTYMREHQVWGWHLHTTDGKFLDCACVSDGDGNDEVYLVVERVINGATVRCIEHLSRRLPGGTLTDAFFVDCGLTYQGTPATTISGLEHLEGKAVSVLGDGKVFNGLTVTNGAITLPVAASVVHIGLPYTSEIQTLDIAINTQTGTVLDKPRSISSVMVRLENSRGALVGGDESDLQAINFNDGQGWGEPAPLWTGDREIFISAPGDYISGRVVIRNVDPVPLTVLAILPRVDYGD